MESKISILEMLKLAGVDPEEKVIPYNNPFSKKNEITKYEVNHAKALLDCIFEAKFVYKKSDSDCILYDAQYVELCLLSAKAFPNFKAGYWYDLNEVVEKFGGVKPSGEEEG